MTVVESDGRTWRRLAGPLLAARAFGQGLEFIGWVVLARRLGASSLGVLSIAFLIARYGGLLADWGASIGGPRDVARDTVGTRTRALVRHRARLAAGLITAYALGCIVIGHGELAPLVGVIAMLGLSRDWIAVGRHQGVRAAVPVVVQGAVLLTVALVAASTEHPAIAVGLGYTAAAVASIVLNPLPPRRGGTSADPISLDPWMLGAVMTNQVLSSADTLVLGLLGTAAATGVYSAVYRLPNGWLAVVSILAGALLPVTTRASADPHRSARLKSSALRTSVAGAAVLIALTPIVYLTVPAIFGDAYRSGRGPVVVLLLATAVATAAAPLHQFFLASGSDRRYAAILGLAGVTIVGASLLLVPRFSMMGAAVATLIAHVVLAAELVWATHGRTR